MIITNEKSSLVLKVKMIWKTIGRHLSYNLLFKLLKIDSASFYGHENEANIGVNVGRG